MAYVRHHGKQLAIVSGNRDKDTGNVQQRILFTFYSKDEAQAAVGGNPENQQSLFQNLMKRAYPDCTFDWEKINKAIEEKIHLLPDKYEGRLSQSSLEFSKSINGLVQKLVLADPFLVPSSKEVLFSQKSSLIALKELLDHSLSVISFYEKQGPTKESEWDIKDEFHWRYTLRGSEVPPDLEDWAETFYKRQDYEKAECIVQALVTAFDNYAEGYNYLGLIALEQRQFKKAILNFNKTVTVGRNLFPRNLAKKHYWLDHDTRPFMRGMTNLILSLIYDGDYDQALEFCDRYEKECGLKDEADEYRATIYLNRGQWDKALSYSSKGFIRALALLETGKKQKALEDFVFSAIDTPHTARMLLDMKKPKPDTSTAIDDHNSGIYLNMQLKGYFKKQSSAAAASFLRALAKQAEFISLLEKVDKHTFNHSNGPREKHHENFSEWHAMQEKPYANQKAKEIMTGITKSSLTVVK